MKILVLDTVPGAWNTENMQDKSMLKSMLIDNDFLTWLLIAVLPANQKPCFNIFVNQHRF